MRAENIDVDAALAELERQAPARLLRTAGLSVEPGRDFAARLERELGANLPLPARGRHLFRRLHFPALATPSPADRGDRSLTTSARLRWPAAIGVAAALLLFAFVSLSPFWVGGDTAQAQEILAYARAATADGVSALPSYHLIATERYLSTFRVTPIERNASGTVAPEATFRTVERWYGGKDLLREETQVSDAGGVVTMTEGRVANGGQSWQYVTQGNQTRVISGLGASGGTSRSYNLLRGTLPDVEMDPTSAIALVGQSGCGTAQMQGDSTVAGRPTYVISVTNDGSCGPDIVGMLRRDGFSRPDEILRGLWNRLTDGADVGTRLTIRIDRQTFLPLGSERYGVDGTVLASYEVSSIDYNVAVPESVFTYTAPANATMCTAVGGTGVRCAGEAPSP